MGQRGEIIDALQSVQRIGFDTPVFVYHIEQTSRWAAAAGSVLGAVEDGTFAGITSVLTLLEVAVKPLQLGRPEIADSYQALLGDISNLTIVNLDLRSARIGAELRATYGLRTPDAFQIAACLAHGADAFVTNDRRLRRVKEIDVVLLDDFM